MGDERFPYINNSGVDIAGKILNHLYPNLQPRNLPLTRDELLNEKG